MRRHEQAFGICAVGFKGAEYLSRLIERGCVPEVVFSYPQADDISNSIDTITRLCREHGTGFVQIKQPDYAHDKPLFVVGWQYMFRGLVDNRIVFHDSLLPKYRGFAPTVNALISGETRVGVTAFRPDEGGDSGPIIGQMAAPVTYPARIGPVLGRQAELMAQLTIDLLPDYRTAIAEAVEQDHAGATYSIWRDRDDYFLDWTESAAKIRRMVDALSFPYDGARTRLDDRIIVIDEASEIEDLAFEPRHPGKVWRLDGGKPVVICGRGLLRLDRVLTCEREPFHFERLRVRLS
jgi:methionyl-tRNA formyltransferase